MKVLSDIHSIGSFSHLPVSLPLFPFCSTFLSLFYLSYFHSLSPLVSLYLSLPPLSPASICPWFSDCYWPNWLHLPASTIKLEKSPWLADLDMVCSQIVQISITPTATLSTEPTWGNRSRGETQRCTGQGECVQCLAQLGPDWSYRAQWRGWISI